MFGEVMNNKVKKRKHRKSDKHGHRYNIWVCNCHGQPSGLKFNSDGASATNTCGIGSDVIDGAIHRACKCGKKRPLNNKVEWR